MFERLQNIRLIPLMVLATRRQRGQVYHVKGWVFFAPPRSNVYLETLVKSSGDVHACYVVPFAFGNCC